MITTSLVVYIAMIVAAATAFLVLIIKTSARHRSLQPLSVLGVVAMVAGIALAADPLLGYGLMSLGILITLVAILKINKLPSRLRKYKG